MSSTMQAVRFHGPRDIRIDTIPVPTPGPSQILLEITHAGICGSDLHEYLIGPQTIPRPDRPHPITKCTLPCPMGHEFCGIVAKSSTPSDSLISANGQSLTPGAKVIVDPRIYCAQSDCQNCSSGATNACPQWGFHGLSGCCGGFSNYVAVESRMCYVLPPETDLSYAALIEPLAVAWHAVKIAGTSVEGKTVLILGGGPIGIALVYVLRVFKAGKVVVSEPAKIRREWDEKVADVVLNPIEVDVVQKCKDLTSGSGVDVVFDAAGVDMGLQAGVQALRYGGTYVNVAGWETPFAIPWFPFMLKDMRIQGSMAYNDEDFAETVEAYIEGKFVGVESMVTSRIDLKDAKEKGFEELINNKDNHIKIMISPQRLDAY